jgi:hypothetical protein
MAKKSHVSLTKEFLSTISEYDTTWLGLPN